MEGVSERRVASTELEAPMAMPRSGASISLLLHDWVFFFYPPSHARWQNNVLLRSLDTPEIVFPSILLAVSEAVLADIVAKARCLEP